MPLGHLDYEPLIEPKNLDMLIFEISKNLDMLNRFFENLIFFFFIFLDILLSLHVKNRKT